jgi:hypothetical protein
MTCVNFKIIRNDERISMNCKSVRDDTKPVWHIRIRDKFRFIGTPSIKRSLFVHPSASISTR